MNTRIKRPSPSMVVAMAALIVAVAGTAVATPIAIRSALDKKEKKQVENISKNQANKAIDQRGPGLSVASAVSAQNAQSAGTANSAGSASNADMVDGRHATCRGGYVAVEGVCYQSSNRAAQGWIGASNDCADENASLPTVGQLKLARDELGNIGFGGEWTDSIDFSDTSLVAWAVEPGIELPLPIASNIPYRCVTPLVR